MECHAKTYMHYCERKDEEHYRTSPVRPFYSILPQLGENHSSDMGIADGDRDTGLSFRAKKHMA